MLLMKYPLLILSLFCLFLFSSCQNSYRQYPVSNSSSSGISGVSEDAYQVTVDEYGDYFESRYGLLYQKFNDKPFTGRILTIDKGESGEYVSSDESWTEGKKDGVSARWFSNGIKMYERNYKEGRWHGTVTRWWPNGQKMYVRAYTNGTRHGKEATWRSDGSPIKLSEKPFISPIKETGIKQIKDDDSESTDTTIDESSSPNVFEPAPFTSDDLPGSVPAIAPSTAEEPPSTVEAIPFPEASTDDTDQNDFPPSEVSSPSGFPALPGSDESSLPELPSTVDSSSDEFPPLPSNEDSLPSIPGSDPATEFPPLPESPADDGGLPPLPVLPEEGPSDELPPLPESSAGDAGLPPLPGLPEEGASDELPPLPESPAGDAGLPPLPGLPDSSDNGLPPLPGFPGDDANDLPPLPGSESNDNSLPPLPAFPE